VPFLPCTAGVARVDIGAPGARSPRARVPVSRIVFTRDLGGIPELFTIGADGHGLRQLTNAAYGADHAAWSPDGKKLVFVLRGLSSDLIYRMDSDGGGLTRLSPPCRGGCIGDGFPSYSLRGSKIVFERDFAEGSAGAIGVALFIVRSDGSDLTQCQLTRLPAGAKPQSPAWGALAN
jgi:Tol biopolymer transport system component